MARALHDLIGAVALSHRHRGAWLTVPPDAGRSGERAGKSSKFPRRVISVIGGTLQRRFSTVGRAGGDTTRSRKIGPMRATPVSRS